MAVLVSPGVLTQEIDLSLYVPALTSTTLGMVGTATKGLTDVATLVTDSTQLAQLFGNSDPNHPMILIAQWYLKFGRQLQIVRVANQGTLATATVDLAGAAATAGRLLGTNTSPFTFTAPTAGSFLGTEVQPYNVIAATNDDLSITVDGGSPQTLTLTAGAAQTAQQIVDDINANTTGLTASVSSGKVLLTSNTTGASSSIQINTPGSHSANATIGFVAGTYSGAAGNTHLAVAIDGGSTQNITLTAGSRTAAQVVSDINGTLTGAVASVSGTSVAISSSTTGTSSSVQGVSSTALSVLGFDTSLHSGLASGGVSITVNANSPGTWGNGLTLTLTDSNSPTIANAKNLTVQLNGFTVEVWKNLVKDTTSPYYWVTQINGKSSFISITDHTGVPGQPANGSKTPLTGGNDGLSGITDADYIGVVGDGYTTGLQCFADPGQIDVNLVAIPGQTSMPVHAALLSLVEGRGDCMTFLDPPSGLTPTQAVQFKTATGAYTSRVALDDNRSAMYYPWVNGFDAANGINVLLPPSAAAIRACVYNDTVGNLWNEFLGVNRGLIPEATGIERKLSNGDRDFLYENGINPIASLPNYGITIMGGKTLQVAPTALDRVNVRRLLDYLHKVVITTLFPLIGEPNTPTLWRRLTGLLQPTLDYIASQQGISQYQIVCDASTNPQNLVNAHEVHAKIGILPTPGAEFIYCDFVLVPDLATFTDYLAPQGQ